MKQRRREVAYAHAIEMHLAIERSIRHTRHVEIGRRNLNSMAARRQAATKRMHRLYRPTKADGWKVHRKHMKYLHETTSDPTPRTKSASDRRSGRRRPTPSSSIRKPSHDR